MYSYVKLPAKVIGVVAVGAGVVALGWLGWRAYAKASEKVVKEVDEVNIVPPPPVPEAPVGDLDQEPNVAPRRKRNASYQRRLARRAKEGEERAAREQQAIPAEDPVVVVVEEDTSPSADQMGGSVEDGASSEPAADPACEEHPSIFTQQELVEDVLVIQGEQLVDGVADAVADAPVRVGRKRNASYSRRLARREERAEKAGREQQAAPTEAAALPVVEEDASVAVDHTPDVIVEARPPAAEEHVSIPVRHECVVDVLPVPDEGLADGVAAEVAVAPGKKRNASYKRRLARRENERAQRAALEQVIVVE